MAVIYPPTTSKIKKRQMIRAATEAATVTLAQYAESMKNNRGNLSKVARELDLPIEIVRRKVKFTPELQRIKRMIVEEKIDKAEEKLDDLVEEGNVTAITYTLNNLGKERGFGKGEDINLDVNVTHSAGLIKRLQENLQEDEAWDDTTTIEVEDFEWVEEDSVDP